MPPGGSGTVHIYTQTVHRTKQLIWEGSGPCPVFANYTLAFALQLRKKHGKTSVRVGKTLSYGRKISVRVDKNLSQGRKTSVRVEKNLGQGRENLSQGRKTSVWVEKNLGQGREKPQSG